MKSSEQIFCRGEQGSGRVAALRRNCYRAFALIQSSIQEVPPPFSISSSQISTTVTLNGLLHRQETVALGRAITQAVSPWPPTAAARVRSQVRSCGIRGGQSGSGVGFLSSSVSPTNSHSTCCSTLIMSSKDGTIADVHFVLLHPKEKTAALPVKGLQRSDS
jgi:hypothetical protein